MAQLHIRAAAIEQVVDLDFVAVGVGLDEIWGHVLLGDEGVRHHQWCLPFAHRGIHLGLTHGMGRGHLVSHPMVATVRLHEKLVGFHDCAKCLCQRGLPAAGDAPDDMQHLAH